MDTERQDSVKQPRGPFPLVWCGAGALVPIALLLGEFLLGQAVNWQPGERLGNAFWILSWVFWPTQIFLVDADHWYQVVMALLLGALFNGIWYGMIGLLVQPARRGLKPVRSSVRSLEGERQRHP